MATNTAMFTAVLSRSCRRGIAEEEGLVPLSKLKMGVEKIFSDAGKMTQFDENCDIEAVRERLRRMDDAALLRWGQVAA
jgi:hypothetical protein